MGSLTLADKVLARAAGSLGEKGARLRIELDMLGVAQEASELITLPRRASGTALAFKKEFAVAAGNPLVAQFAKALESDEIEDSEVQFVVLACDEKGNELPEGEIGVARCSLEQLVSEGKDHSGPLSIIGTSVDGVIGAKLGELTVGAIAALTPCAVSAGRAPVSALESKLATKAVVTVGATAATITSASAKPAKKTPLKLLVKLGGQPTVVEPLATAEGSSRDGH